MAEQGTVEELSRVRRVSDQSCTGYSVLRDRYHRRAMILDLSVLLLSTWLVAMVFVQPAVAIALSPRNIPRDLWLGLLSIGTFALSLVQLKVNWKGRAATYQRALALLNSFVRECRVISDADTGAIHAALRRYHAITESIEPIPEAEFLALKKRHKLKVEISKYLDSHPGATLWLLRTKIWLRDNSGGFKK